MSELSQSSGEAGEAGEERQETLPTMTAGQSIKYDDLKFIIEERDLSHQVIVSLLVDGFNGFDDGHLLFRWNPDKASEEVRKIVFSLLDVMGGFNRLMGKDHKE